MISFSVRGDKSILRKLKGLEPKVRRKVIGKSARAAMRPVLAAAKANAPYASGKLRKSIKLRAMRRNRRGNVGVRVATSDKWFQGDEFYGAFQEFGWKAGKRLRKSQIAAGIADNRKQVPGKHYAQRAYEQHGEQALRTFMETVPIEIERIARGG